jgi:hypothetical protein
MCGDLLTLFYWEKLDLRLLWWLSWDMFPPFEWLLGCGVEFPREEATPF